MALTDKSSIVVPKGFYGKANVLQGFNPQTENLVDLDVVRNTTATRVNEQGLIENVAANLPRRDFLNGGCGELLVEPQRTNIVTYSEQFDNAEWDKRGTCGVISNNTIAPDGNQTADLITNIGGATNDIFQITSGNANAATEPSLFIKKENATGQIEIKNPIGTNIGLWQIDFSLISSEWERVTSTHQAVTVVNQFKNNSSGSGGMQILRNTGSGDFHVWGAQLEEGTYPTSYIPTTASAVTRNQDVISATNIGSLLNDAKGGVYIDWKAFDSQTSISLNDPNLQRTGVNIAIPMTGRIEYKLEIDNVEQCNINTINNFLNVQNKTAVRYANNNFALFVDGAKIGQDNTGNTFNSGQLTELKFNSVFPADQPFFGRIRELTVFNNALTDTELQTLTTP